MLFVVFKPLDPRKQTNSPPLIILLDKSLINETVIQLKTKVHSHFKPYLSPFINEDNLKLINKKGDSMINEFPLYMYLDPNQNMQHVYCTTQPNKLKENYTKWKYLRNSIVFKAENDDEIKIIPKEEVKRVDNLIKTKLQKDPATKIIINADTVEANPSQQWSSILTEYWPDFVCQIQCIYIHLC